MHSDSIWKDVVMRPRENTLDRDMEVEVAIIGGGIAGILTAYLLKERGVSSVILEADTVCSGQTGRTTAKITSQHGRCYDRLTARFGREGAQQYANANQGAIEAYAALIKKLGIDCDFTRLPAFLYSTEEKDPLEKEAEAAKALGLPASYTIDTGLPFPVAGAVRFENQAQFHPLKFLSALIPALTIYEHTKVLFAEGNVLKTERRTVRAKKIVFACHYPFLNVPGYYFMRMHQERSYVLALSNAMEFTAAYIGMDENKLSLRSHGGLLLLGGGAHRTGDNKEGGKYELLRAAAVKYFPNSREEARWSAQDCMTHDGVPYIGRFSHDTPDWYIATGFQKWGMTASMAAATLLSDAIAKGKDDAFGVFSPDRYVPAAAVPELLKDGGQTVKGLTRQLFHIPGKTLEELPRSHGGVVDAEGEKLGVYKNERGECFAVHTRCPHLGCELTYNPDETSWDCPCHGSRFAHTGDRLDGPAQEDVIGSNTRA
ncbi:MAG TPA: FAD-dependent oxidoreductase [Feifaniaceae bacterium]|nr:FAD-dependent oxidoreductase [Feifaniaceae bacterium]